MPIDDFSFSMLTNAELGVICAFRIFDVIAIAADLNASVYRIFFNFTTHMNACRFQFQYHLFLQYYFFF
jgi:hypothetical protein